MTLVEGETGLQDVRGVVAAVAGDLEADGDLDLVLATQSEPRGASVSEQCSRRRRARILTDTELRERSYHPPYIDLSGSDWQFPVFDLTGTWTVPGGDAEFVVRADGRAYRFSPAIFEWDHFYVVGKTVYPVALNGSVVGYQWGTYEQTASSSTITWGVGPRVWVRAGPHPSSSTRAVTIRPRFAVTKNDYEVDFSNYLQPYGTLSFSSPNVKTKRFKQTNVTPTGSTLLFEDGSTGTFSIQTAISRIDLSGGSNGVFNGMT